MVALKKSRTWGCTISSACWSFSSEITWVFSRLKFALHFLLRPPSLSSFLSLSASSYKLKERIMDQICLLEHGSTVPPKGMLHWSMLYEQALLSSVRARCPSSHYGKALQRIMVPLNACS